jgi:hypothetical protein
MKHPWQGNHDHDFTMRGCRELEERLDQLGSEFDSRGWGGMTRSAEGAIVVEEGKIVVRKERWWGGRSDAAQGKEP